MHLVSWTHWSSDVCFLGKIIRTKSILSQASNSVSHMNDLLRLKTLQMSALNTSNV